MQLTLLRASLGLEGKSLAVENKSSGKAQCDAAEVGDWLVLWFRVWSIDVGVVVRATRQQLVARKIVRFTSSED